MAAFCPVEVQLFVAKLSLDSSSKATTNKNYFHQQVNIAIKACCSFLFQLDLKEIS